MNFIYDIPTKVYFGDYIDKIGEVAQIYGSSHLIIYQGDFIKENGLLEKVETSLKKHDSDYIEFSNIKSNPVYNDVLKGVEICKKEKVNSIIAIGGGSVIDSAKAIAACSCFDGDAWDMISGKVKPEKILPIICVSTISATGSEMDSGAVITNEDLNDKIVFSDHNLYPKVTFLDPKLTYTVSKFQTACGVVDIIAHILEEYFSQPALYLHDTFMEGMLRTVFKYGPLAYFEPQNYEARANLMWASEWAINGLISFDRPHNWSMHPLGHGLSAYYDLTHGLTLAIVMPRWLRFVYDKESAPLFTQLAVNCLNCDENKSSSLLAEEVITFLEDLFYKTLDLPSNLAQLNIDPEHFEDMAAHICQDQEEYLGYRKMTKNDIISIYMKCLH